ncbi:MAG: VacJ family lipoprotein [Burkholderiales bacterium]
MGRGIGKRLSILILVSAITGCASPGGHPQDPFEPFNRTMFSINETVDEAVLQPVARGYRAVLPELVRNGVSNFFSNLEDLWIGVNNFIQGKPADGVQDVARFVFNTSFGLFGLVDASTDFNLPKHNEDFGQTLGRWGADAGPYLVLPLFGPSNVRDAIGFAVDFKADVVRNIGHVPTRNTLFTVRTVNTRANLLDIGRVAEEAALDKYRFMRDAHFQRRRNLIYDGEPPRESGSSALSGDMEIGANFEALGEVSNVVEDIGATNLVVDKPRSALDQDVVPN